MFWNVVFPQPYKGLNNKSISYESIIIENNALSDKILMYGKFKMFLMEPNMKLENTTRERCHFPICWKVPLPPTDDLTHVQLVEHHVHHPSGMLLENVQAAGNREQPESSHWHSNTKQDTRVGSVDGFTAKYTKRKAHNTRKTLVRLFEIDLCFKGTWGYFYSTIINIIKM